MPNLVSLNGSGGAARDLGIDEREQLEEKYNGGNRVPSAMTAAQFGSWSSHGGGDFTDADAAAGAGVKTVGAAAQNTVPNAPKEQPDFFARLKKALLGPSAGSGASISQALFGG